jgi:hypothetical protein
VQTAALWYVFYSRVTLLRKCVRLWLQYTQKRRHKQVQSASQQIAPILHLLTLGRPMPTDTMSARVSVLLSVPVHFLHDLTSPAPSEIIGRCVQRCCSPVLNCETQVPREAEEVGSGWQGSIDWILLKELWSLSRIPALTSLVSPLRGADECALRPVLMTRRSCLGCWTEDSEAGFSLVGNVYLIDDVCKESAALQPSLAVNQRKKPTKHFSYFCAAFPIPIPCHLLLRVSHVNLDFGWLPSFVIECRFLAKDSSRSWSFFFCTLWPATPVAHSCTLAGGLPVTPECSVCAPAPHCTCRTEALLPPSCPAPPYGCLLAFEVLAGTACLFWASTVLGIGFVLIHVDRWRHKWENKLPLTHHKVPKEASGPGSLDSINPRHRWFCVVSTFNTWKRCSLHSVTSLWLCDFFWKDIAIWSLEVIQCKFNRILRDLLEKVWVPG